MDGDFLNQERGGFESLVFPLIFPAPVQARYVTALPDNPLGQACLNSLRQWGVETGFIARQGQRLGALAEAGHVLRLAPLAQSVAPVAPSERVWRGIEAQLFGERARQGGAGQATVASDAYAVALTIARFGTDGAANDANGLLGQRVADDAANVVRLEYLSGG